MRGTLGAHRCVPEARHAAGLLGRAPRRGCSAHAAHARRPAAHQVPRSAAVGAGGLHQRDSHPHAERDLQQGTRPGLLLCVRRRRALPRQCLPQGDRRRRHLPFHPFRGADAGEAAAAADRDQAVRLPPGHGAGDRLHRHRQVHDAGGDDRSSEQHAPAQHHQPRGSDRVRACEQEQPGHPARARYAHPQFRGRRTRGHARRPGRHPGGRAARCRNHLHGHDGRRDRAPGARHAAHDDRGQDHRSHHRRPAGGRARTDQELPRAEPACRGDPGAGQDPGFTRPQGDLRGADDDQGDRQAHPDRTDAPDPHPDADGQGSGHAAARPGAAGRHQRAHRRPGRRLRLRRPRNAPSRSTSPIPACCRNSTAPAPRPPRRPARPAEGAPWRTSMRC